MHIYVTIGLMTQCDDLGIGFIRCVFCLPGFACANGKQPQEGIDKREMEMHCYLHFCRHFLVERRRPRNYARCGLVKLEHKDGAVDGDVGRGGDGVCWAKAT